MTHQGGTVVSRKTKQIIWTRRHPDLWQRTKWGNFHQTTEPYLASPEPIPECHHPENKPTTRTQMRGYQRKNTRGDNPLPFSSTQSYACIWTLVDWFPTFFYFCLTLMGWNCIHVKTFSISIVISFQNTEMDLMSEGYNNTFKKNLNDTSIFLLQRIINT